LSPGRRRRQAWSAIERSGLSVTIRTQRVKAGLRTFTCRAPIYP
jgi:hypothetical protein